MTVELSIIMGLGIIGGLCAYIGFQFYNKAHGEQTEQDAGTTTLHWDGIISTICFLLTIIFLNMIMYTLVLIAQNTTGFEYLNDTILVIGMQAIMWSTLTGIGLYIFVLLLGSLYFLYHNVMSWWKGRRKGDVW